ncbi:hypothetical protein ACHQM5_030113 [Ranunculus cassubicifolius]
MPRTIAVDCQGCPPIRAFTFDILGLIKVIESPLTQQKSVPTIVQSYGQPDASRSILTASINDRKFNPVLALARKNGHIELVNPLNGDVRAEIVDENGGEDPIVGLHLFRKERNDLSSRTCTLLTCTTKGNAALRSIEVGNSSADSTSSDASATWDVCSSGDVVCSAVDGNENHAVFGGKKVEVNLWDLEKRSKIWTSKPPPKNSLGIFTPTWFSALTFLDKEDHRKIVAGTNAHQARLYDISAQRRPILTFDFGETPIKALTADPDGHTIYLGNGSGDLASVDIRTGKLLGRFLGKCSGSIRSIVRHPELPVIVSCGLDCYLRYWDVKTRQLLSAVFLKQHLTSVVIDSNFSDEETSRTTIMPPPTNDETLALEEEQEDDESPPLKRKKKSSKDGMKHKSKKKKSKNTVEEEED